jgi:hypothetical protein
MMDAEVSSAVEHLRSMRREILALRGYSAGLRAMKPFLPSLRRRILKQCHPDRGGDAELTQDVNALFDFLERGT